MRVNRGLDLTCIASITPLTSPSPLVHALAGLAERGGRRGRSHQAAARVRARSSPGVQLTMPLLPHTMIPEMRELQQGASEALGYRQVDRCES